MNWQEAGALKPGDKVIATTGGVILGTRYAAGEIATVRGHDPAIFVEFVDGRIGHPLCANWEPHEAETARVD